MGNPILSLALSSLQKRKVGMLVPDPYPVIAASPPFCLISLSQLCQTLASGREDAPRLLDQQ